MNHTRIIQIVFAGIFCIIAFSSFALSYINLTAAAVEAGIIPTLAPLWPLCLDAFIIMGSLFILQANLNNEPATGFTVIRTVAKPYGTGAHVLVPVQHAGKRCVIVVLEG